MEKDIPVTEKHKSLLRLLYAEALQRGKLELIDEIFAPDFIDHSSEEQAPGRAGVRDYFLAVRQGFPDIQIVIEDMIAEGERIAVRTTWRGTHLGMYEGVSPSGKKVSRTLLQIFRVTDGLLDEEWNEGAGLLDSSMNHP